VVLGAIVVVGAESTAVSAQGVVRSSSTDWRRDEGLFPDPLICAEVLGRTMVEHIVERFVNATVETVTVLVHPGVCALLSPFRQVFDRVTIRVAADLEAAVAETLKRYASEGVDYTFVTDANTYSECDLIDLVWFHRGSRRTITRTFDRGGPLNLSIASCTRTQPRDARKFLAPAVETGSDCYFISDSVHRFTHPQDMRSLVQDALRGRCEIRPMGKEVRPGVWVDEGAQLHKRARVVAPAYIGKDSVVREDTVVTRCSNIESRCYIDYGTVIEDSSVLTNSYVGIWLDVTHAVVQGNNLWNLARNVGLEIGDPSVVRHNSPESLASKRDVRVIRKEDSSDSLFAATHLE
jgi:NDP-sugar pyrophosphorylase family protein